MKKLFISLLFLLAFYSTKVHAQNIDPSYQINWANSTGCSTVGQPYIPQSNTCVPLGFVLLAPSGAQTIVQPSVSAPLNVNYLSQAFSNGVIFADAFCGLGTIGGVTTPSCSADMGTKVAAAVQYALGNNIAQVDATHFQGTQPVSVNMWATPTVAGNHVAGITITYGAVHMQATAVQHITASGIHIKGAGNYQTILEYTGSTAAAQGIIYVDGTTGTGSYAPGANGLNNFSIEGFAIYGDVANANDGIQAVAVNRSKFSDLSFWGVTNCGIHTLAAVTDTFSRVHTSVADAFYLGIQSGSHSVPSGGLCFEAFGGIQTTNGTVIDAAAEGVTGWGWQLISAQTMVFTSGTSEQNGIANTSGGGVLISAPSKYNVFISSDIEANVSDQTGGDITDNGGYNTFIQLLSSSPCTGGCSATVDLTGSAGNDLILGGPFQGVLYNATGAGVFGLLPTNKQAGGTLPGTTQGYLPFTIGGTQYKIPFYTYP
jgi:hypothetical protein